MYEKIVQLYHIIEILAEAVDLPGCRYIIKQSSYRTVCALTLL